MTDTPFKAPPIPPRAPAIGAINQPAISAPITGGVSGTERTPALPEDNIASALKLSPSIFRTKVAGSILAGSLIIGILLGAMMFSGSPAPVSVASGLGGIILNPDIRQNDTHDRCGTVSRTYPCLVYIVNHSLEDHVASYFFDEAARLTGRTPYLVNMENTHYTGKRIPPGFIAQIKIPPIR